MTEFIQVAVPKHRVLEVYALLASEPGNGRSDQQQFPVPGWDDELLRRAYGESPDSLANLLVYLSDRPDVIVTAQELAEGIGRTRQQLAGVLGAFGRRVKNRYQMDSWPFEAWEDARKGMLVYRMDAHTAALIQTMRREESATKEAFDKALNLE